MTNFLRVHAKFDVEATANTFKTWLQGELDKLTLASKEPGGTVQKIGQEPLFDVGSGEWLICVDARCLNASDRNTLKNSAETKLEEAAIKDDVLKSNVWEHTCTTAQATTDNGCVNTEHYSYTRP